jgi:Zn-dependent protease with chaperone function
MLALQWPETGEFTTGSPSFLPMWSVMKLLSRISPNTKTVLIIIGLPLLLIALSLWQIQRTPNTADYPKNIADLQAAIEQLEMLSRTKGPTAFVQLDDGKSYSVNLALPAALQEKARLENSMFWEGTVAATLARAGFFIAIATTLFGCLFLLRIRIMGRKALKSREDLLKTFQSGQRLLPWSLALLASLLFAAMICAISYEVLRLFFSSDHLSRGEQKLMIGGAIFAVSLVYIGFKAIWNLITTSRAVFEREPLMLMGRSVSQQEAPRLWSFINNLADRVKAKIPDSIVVGLNECFFVTENRVRLATGEDLPAGRVLYLPLPYMAFMSKSETAAVIGHELAHFTGDDTEYSLRFSPIYSATVNNLVAVHSAGEWIIRPVTMLGEFFLRSFDRAVQHWSRIRELAADQMGAQVANKEAAAAALLRVSVLAPRVDEALASCWREGGKTTGVLPETRRLIKEKGLDDPKIHLEAHQAHPTDSHPTTSQRLEALGVTVSEALLAHAQDPRGSQLLLDLGLESEDSGEENSITPVSKALEVEFSTAAETDKQETIETLKEMVNLGSEKIDIYEGRAYAILLSILTAGSFVISFIVLYTANPETKTIAFASFFAAGILLLWGTLRLFKRSRNPAMTLSANGVAFGNLQGVLPWSSIEDYNLQTVENNGFVTITVNIDLANGYEPILISKKGHAKYKPKKQQLAVKLLGVSGMKSDEFPQVLYTYWQAHLARLELAKYKTAAL